MSFERKESIVHLRTIHFIAREAELEGLSAQLDPESGIVTISFASIEGQSALQIPLSRVAGLSALLAELSRE